MNSTNKIVIKLLILVILLSGSLIVLLYNKAEITTQPSQTQLVKSYTCENSNCYDLSVVCENLEPTNLTIKETLVENAKSSIIMASGETGNQFYTQQSNVAAETVNLLLHTNANIYELMWTDSYGWLTNAENKGVIATSCRFNEAVNWISTHINESQITATNMCAVGTGEASQLLGNGLVFYDADKIIKTAVLAGGPPFSKLDIACFGDAERPDAKLPDADPSKILIDYLMGWRNNGNYCVNANASSEAVLLAKSAGLISENPKADYFYDSNVIFINSNDETNADDQGKIYYDQIISGKEWIKTSGSRHDLQNTQEGAEKISSVLIRECLN